MDLLVGWARPFTTSPRPAADPGFRVVRRLGAAVAPLQSPAAAGRTRGRRGVPFGLPFPSLYSCEHDVTGADLEQPFRADGRKLTKERRYAPTSVHVRRIPRSTSPDLAFNFTGMRSDASRPRRRPCIRLVRGGCRRAVRPQVPTRDRPSFTILVRYATSARTHQSRQEESYTELRASRFQGHGNAGGWRAHCHEPVKPRHGNVKPLA